MAQDPPPPPYPSVQDEPCDGPLQPVSAQLSDAQPASAPPASSRPEAHQQACEPVKPDSPKRKRVEAEEHEQVYDEDGSSLYSGPPQKKTRLQRALAWTKDSFMRPYHRGLYLFVEPPLDLSTVPVFPFHLPEVARPDEPNVQEDPTSACAPAQGSPPVKEHPVPAQPSPSHSASPPSVPTSAVPVFDLEHSYKRLAPDQFGAPTIPSFVFTGPDGEEAAEIGQSRITQDFAMRQDAAVRSKRAELAAYARSRAQIRARSGAQ